MKERAWMQSAILAGLAAGCLPLRGRSKVLVLAGLLVLLFVVIDRLVRSIDKL